MKKIVIDETKLGDFEYWNTLFKTNENQLKKPKKISKRELLSDAYKKAPDNVRLDKVWVMKAIKDYNIGFYVIDDLIKDKDFCIEYIEELSYPHLSFVPQQLQEELAEKAIVKYPYNIQELFYRRHLQHLITRDNLSKWVDLNPELYKELEKTRQYKNDFSLAEIAVRKNPELLLKMNKSIARKIISRNLDMAMQFLEKNIKIFYLLPLKLRNNKNFVMPYISKLDYEQVSYIGIKVLEDREAFLCLNNFYDIKIPEQYWKDREVVFHVINKSHVIHNEFQDCESFKLPELIRSVLSHKKSVYFYKNLPERFQKNEEVICGLLDLNYFKDIRKVTKTMSGTSYTYQDNETFDNSVVNILPENIKLELIKEYKEISENNFIPDEQQLLSFAKGKYLQICLKNKLEDKVKTKQLKI